EVVPMIKKIEAFQPEQDTSAFRWLEATLDKQSRVRGRGAAKRRLADDFAVNDGPVIVRTVTVIVHARRGIERTRGRKLCHGTGRNIVRELVAERNDGAMTLIHQT